VEIDSRGILKVRTWKRSSPDRQVSRHYFKEAKARLLPVMLWKEEEEEEKQKKKID
jgi:hypothetical protein